MSWDRAPGLHRDAPTGFADSIAGRILDSDRPICPNLHACNTPCNLQLCIDANRRILRIRSLEGLRASTHASLPCDQPDCRQDRRGTLSHLRPLPGNDPGRALHFDADADFGGAAAAAACALWNGQQPAGPHQAQLRAPDMGKKIAETKGSKSVWSQASCPRITGTVHAGS